MNQPQLPVNAGSFSLATLYCPVCENENLEAHRTCQTCQSPLPKRYLRVIWPSDREPLGMGQFLDGRFLVRGKNLVFDTQPGHPPPLVDPPTSLVEPYFKLFPYRLHVPQIYGFLSAPEPILLLELGPWGKVDLPPNQPVLQLPLDLSGLTSAVPLTQAWGHAGLLRKLNWLRQLLLLWEPLQQVRAAKTLLLADHLRVEGPIARLVQLQFTSEAEAPTLMDLAQAWHDLGTWPDATIENRFRQLWENLPPDPTLALAQLDAAFLAWIEQVAGNYHYEFDLATQTDQGPRRKRNEDNCYPISGTVAFAQPQVLTVVCDGVGGHAGGDVASGLGIQTFVDAADSLTNPELLGLDLEQTLEKVIYQANDVIAAQNDAEARQERQRMGTTLVTALTREHLMYIAHVGDSRAYWITPYGCYQVTLDDDVACREVRLGLNSYRSALEHPYSGSLIQALGMGPAMHLHPAIQSLVLDESCLFLLCSDGLSDLDRVEQNWQELLLPLLAVNEELAHRREDLITLANTLNGHDNVTVSLIRCHVRPPTGVQPEPDYLELLYPQTLEFSTDILPQDTNLELEEARTQGNIRPTSSFSWLRIAAALLLTGCFALLAYLAWSYWLNPALNSETPMEQVVPETGY